MTFNPQTRPRLCRRDKLRRRRRNYCNADQGTYVVVSLVSAISVIQMRIARLLSIAKHSVLHRMDLVQEGRPSRSEAIAYTRVPPSPKQVVSSKAAGPRHSRGDPIKAWRSSKRLVMGVVVEAPACMPDLVLCGPSCPPLAGVVAAASGGGGVRRGRGSLSSLSWWAMLGPLATVAGLRLAPAGFAGSR